MCRNTVVKRKEERRWGIEKSEAAIVVKKPENQPEGSGGAKGRSGALDPWRG